MLGQDSAHTQEMQDRDPKWLRNNSVVSKQEAIFPSKQSNYQNDWLDPGDKI